MAKNLPFIEVGRDPIDGGGFLLLSLSGMRQFHEILTEALSVFNQALQAGPEQPNQLLKTEIQCGSVHVVMMTDDTLAKVLTKAGQVFKTPPQIEYKAPDGTSMPSTDIITDAPGWLDQLMGDNLAQEPEADV